MIIRARIRRLVMERPPAIDHGDVRRVLASELTGLFRSGVVPGAMVKERLGRALTLESRRRGRR